MTMEERDEMIREEGVEYGREMTLIGMICRKLQKGKSPKGIADELEVELKRVLPICEAAKAFAPEYDCEAIYAALHEEE